MQFKFLFIFLLVSCSFQSSSALVIDPVEMDMRDPDQKTTNQAVGTFEAAFSGYRLNVPVIMENTKRGIDTGLQAMMSNLNNHTRAFAFETSVLVDSAQKWTLNDATAVQKCLTMLTVPGNLSAGITRKSIIAHEAFHCFQFQIAGTFNAVIAKPSWITEGTAMFAGEDYVKESTPQFGEAFLSVYVAEPKSIFNRSYDSYPFFLHLKKEGVNVYALIKQLLESRASSRDLWQIIVNTVPHDALISWASSLMRKPEWGVNWDLKVNTFMPDPAFKLPFTHHVGYTLPFTIPGEMGAPKHDQVMLVDNQVTKIFVENGVAAIHYFPEGFPNGRTLRLHEGESIQFCKGTNCDCPGSSGGIRTLKVSYENIFIASVSTTADHKVHVEEGTLSCCGNTGKFDARMIGTWSASINRILDLWVRFSTLGTDPANVTSSGQGTVEFQISPQGNLVKSYQDVQFNLAQTNGRDIGTAKLNLFYEVTGCITTRAINSDRGWFELSNVVDQTEWAMQKQSKPIHPVQYSRGHGEWFQFGICVEGNNGCSSTYYMEGDLLRFHGGTANSNYPDLVKVSD